MRSMAQALSRPPKTRDDLLALPDHVRAELIEGELYVTPAPSLRHQDLVARLWRALDDWARPERRGWASIGANVDLPSGNVVVPDVLFVAAARHGILGERVRGAPDLVVEVVSPGHPDRDRFVKRTLYARDGIPEYWIVHPEDAAIEVLRLESTSYVPAGYFRRGSALASPSLAGFSLSLESLFAPTDGLP